MVLVLIPQYLGVRSTRNTRMYGMQTVLRRMKIIFHGEAHVSQKWHLLSKNEYISSMTHNLTQGQLILLKKVSTLP